MAIFVLCKKCEGEGYVKFSFLGVSFMRKCKKCKGKGKIREKSYQIKN